MYVYVYVCIYIYIYMIILYVCMYVCIYIYIYIYRLAERGGCADPEGAERRRAGERFVRRQRRRSAGSVAAICGSGSREKFRRALVAPPFSPSLLSLSLLTTLYNTRYSSICMLLILLVTLRHLGTPPRMGHTAQQICILSYAPYELTRCPPICPCTLNAPPRRHSPHAHPQQFP